MAGLSTTNLTVGHNLSPERVELEEEPNDRGVGMAKIL